MTLRIRRWAAAAGAGLALAFPSTVPANSGAQTQTSTSSLIGSYDAWIHGRRTDVELIAVDLDAARQELARLDPSSLPAKAGATQAEIREGHRRLITAFALELAAIGSRRHAAAAARLIEWACPYVRSHTPKNDFDRAWQLAALSALEGGIDSRVLREHLDHLHGAFDDDPRLLLARGIVEEQFSAPSEVLTRSLSAADLARAREEMVRAQGERYRAAERAIVHFKEASADDAIRAEAALRLGHVELGLGRADAALAAWSGLERLTQDRAVVYLVHLFRGVALESAGRPAEARDSYVAALGVSQGAHSATLRLAALGFRHGRGDEPVALVNALLRNDDPRKDPWWSYYAADWRFWYQRIERVRELLK